MVEVAPNAEGRSPPVLTGIEIINPAPETRCRASQQLVFLAASSASSDLDFYHGLLGGEALDMNIDEPIGEAE